MPEPSGVLVVAATPIGNVGDASPRLRAALATADVVAAEDTRRLRRLCADLDVSLSARVVSMFEGNERERGDELVEAVRAGRRVVLVTDAGMPLVSDPGYRLVASCADAGLPVTVVPGPSAVLAALVVSGLPADRFCVEGFLPRKAGERDRRLADLAHEPRTLVLFESPRRTAATLAALAVAFGADRPAAVCRELTKTHEQVRRGTLADLAASTDERVLGEVTIVVAGRPAGATSDNVDPVALVADREAAGLSRKEAIADVARELGRPRREVYAAVVSARAAAAPAAEPDAVQG
jgi:16S rRNA (cytidine1402-2'-O)-methyltransferase